MNIIYNGAQRTDGILTFSEVHNILQVTEDIYGSQAVIKLALSSSWKTSVNAASQFSLTLFGETITNVLSPSEAKNKKFFIGETAKDTAISMCRALRNCGAVAADFVITTGTTSSTGDSVLLTAKTIGRKTYTGFYERATIPASSMTMSIVDGSADEDDAKFINSQIGVEVYEDDEYVTTLEKNFYGNECSFDVTPVLATMTDSANEGNGQIKRYRLNVTKLAEDGTYATLGSVSGYTTNGFLANQSQKYLPLGIQLLNNNKTSDRGSTIYTYDRKIQYSVLGGTDSTNRFSVSYSVKDNTGNEIYSYNDYVNVPYGTPSILDLEYTMPLGVYYSGHSIDVTVANDNTMRFEIIKPLNAAEGWQRILWRNEYGGISYVDYTGANSITNDIDIETYEKNIFDYYESNVSQSRKIYSNKVTKTLKLKTHLMKKNGTYIFNSLMRSKMVWMVDNGKTIYLIPKAIEINEDGTYNDIYTVTSTFEFSDVTNL